MKFITIILLFLGFVFLTGIPPAVLTETGSADLVVPNFWVMFGFLSGLTFIVIVAVLWVQKINPEFYAQAFLAATTFKIVTCLIFILVFLRKNHVDKLIFVSDFFYVYFLNTVFEVYGLLRSLRNQNLGQKT